jgi:hypothetical protein
MPTFDIELNEWTNPEHFVSLHWMGYRLADVPGSGGFDVDRVYIDRTGIVGLELKGGSDWVRKTLRVGVDGERVRPLLNLGPARPGYHWEVQPVMWSVSAAPASIFNGRTAVNAGWAVDTCNTEWDFPDGEPASSGNLLGPILLYLNLGVSDTDGILYRISYDFRAVGNLRQVRDDVVDRPG